MNADLRAHFWLCNKKIVSGNSVWFSQSEQDNEILSLYFPQNMPSSKLEPTRAMWAKNYSENLKSCTRWTTICVGPGYISSSHWLSGELAHSSGKCTIQLLFSTSFLDTLTYFTFHWLHQPEAWKSSGEIQTTDRPEQLWYQCLVFYFHLKGLFEVSSSNTFGCDRWCFFRTKTQLPMSHCSHTVMMTLFLTSCAVFFFVCFFK